MKLFLDLLLDAFIGLGIVVVCSAILASLMLLAIGLMKFGWRRAVLLLRDKPVAPPGF